MPAPLYNGPFETALRSVVCLASLPGRACLREDLTMVDHAVVNSTDFGGPPSLHPALPNRANEIVVRRDAIDAGLAWAESRGLAERVAESVAATEVGARFVGDLRSAYARGLVARAGWISGLAGVGLGRELSSRWSPRSTRIRNRLAKLDACYVSDLARMDALREAALAMACLRDDPDELDVADAAVAEMRRIASLRKGLAEVRASARAKRPASRTA